MIGGWNATTMGGTDKHKILFLELVIYNLHMSELWPQSWVEHTQRMRETHMPISASLHPPPSHQHVCTRDNLHEYTLKEDES